MRARIVIPLLMMLFINSSVVGASGYPEPEIQTMGNGLQVAWMLSDRLPLLNLILMVRLGHRDDPVGKSGSAELLSQLMDRGLELETADLGARLWVGVNGDSTLLGIQGFSPDWEKLLGLLSRAAMRTEFSETDFLRARSHLLERLERVGDSTFDLANLGMDRVLSAGTPYSRGEISTRREFEKLMKSDILRFYRERFVPDEAMLMVVGQVDRTRFFDSVRRTFGTWEGKRPASPPQARRAPFVLKPRQILVIDRPGVSQAQIRVGLPLFAPRHPDRHALSVANAAVGEHINSRLNSEIRDRLGLTYGIESRLMFSSEFGSLVVQTHASNGNVGKLVRETFKIFEDIHRTGLTEDEIRVAKEYLVGGYPVRMATLSAVASKWLAGFVLGLGKTHVNEYPSRIRALESNNLTRALREHLNPKKIRIVVSGDAEKIEKALRKSGYTSIKRVRASDLM